MTGTDIQRLTGWGCLCVCLCLVGGIDEIKKKHAAGKKRVRNEKVEKKIADDACCQANDQIDGVECKPGDEST